LKVVWRCCCYWDGSDLIGAEAERATVKVQHRGGGGKV
jgi:hypothetical protein